MVKRLLRRTNVSVCFAVLDSWHGITVRLDSGDTLIVHYKRDVNLRIG